MGARTSWRDTCPFYGERVLKGKQPYKLASAAGTCPVRSAFTKAARGKRKRSKQLEQNPYYKCPHRNGQSNANQTAFRKISIFFIHFFIFLFYQDGRNPPCYHFGAYGEHYYNNPFFENQVMVDRNMRLFI